MEHNDNNETVQIALSDAKEKIALAESVRRLEKNRDFKKVIMDGYFEKEAGRLARLTGQDGIPAENKQNIISKLQGIGALYNYFVGIMQEGAALEIQVKEFEEKGEC